MADPRAGPQQITYERPAAQGPYGLGLRWNGYSPFERVRLGPLCGNRRAVEQHIVNNHLRGVPADSHEMIGH